MSEHPIEGLMTTAMNSIQDMIDVNTIIGEPIETSNNIIIIPISKVGFGFAAGGSEFKGETIDEYTKKEKEEAIQYRHPFGGGSGAGVCITPVAFLVVQSNNVKLLPVNHSSALDKLLDYVPDLFEKVNSMLNKQMANKKEEAQRKEKMQERIEKQTINHMVNDTIIRPEQVATGNIKARPKKNKISKPSAPIYEFEYDETVPPMDFEQQEENDDEE